MTTRSPLALLALCLMTGCPNEAQPEDAARTTDAFSSAADATSISAEDAFVASDAPTPMDAPVNCRTITDADVCVAQACRWMQHGCGETAQVWPTGCYPSTDCTGPADCPASESACTLAVYLPYPNDNPKACGLMGSICVDESL